MFRTDALQITPELLNLIARIDEFKGAWRAFGTLAPERLSALRRVAMIEQAGEAEARRGEPRTVPPERAGREVGTEPKHP